MARLGRTRPAPEELVLDAELVEHLSGRLVDEIIDRRRSVVEAGHRRQDSGAGLGDGDHVAHVDQAERRLAWNEHERPALLQRDVRGACKQVAAQPVGDRRQRAHRARRHDHPHREERSRRDRRGEVAGLVDDVGQRLDVADLEVGLQLDRAVRRARHHEVGLDARQITERAEQRDAVVRRARATDADDEAAGGSGHWCTVVRWQLANCGGRCTNDGLAAARRGTVMMVRSLRSLTPRRHRPSRPRGGTPPRQRWPAVPCPRSRRAWPRCCPCSPRAPPRCS